MFQGLRVASPIYVFYKSEPKLLVGEVLSVSNPLPQFPITNYQQPQQNTVDLHVRINEEEIDLKQLPANAVIADFGNSGMVISESKEAILSEVEGFMKLNIAEIEKNEQRQNNVELCKQILTEFSPQLKNEAEISKIRQDIAVMQSSFDEFKGMLSKILKQENKDN